MKIKLRALTPLHIGTGEELAPLDYVALSGNNRFYRISQEQMLRFVSENIDNGPRAFAEWISGQYRAMRDIRDNRTLSAMADALNPYEFCVSEGKQKEFERYLNEQKNEIFSAPLAIDDFTRGRHRGARHIPLGRVREAIKNGKEQPLLPGTSVKGALRTAVFYHYLTQHADSRTIENLVRQQLRDKRARKERFALPLAYDAFFCSTKDLVSKREKNDDEKMDLFKLVRCTDGHPEGEEQALSLAKVNIYLVEKKQSRDKKESYFEATQQRQTSYCETISAETVISTELDFDIDFLLQAKPLLKDGAVRSGDQLHWIGIEKKVEQLFGIRLTELTAENKEAFRQKVTEHLFACLKAFSDAQLAAYQQWLGHFRQNDKRDNYTSRIAAGSAPVLNRQGGRLLHLGYATGFDGMTAILYFLADDKRKALFKEVMERFNLGNKPGNKGKYTPNPNRFPKSKRLVDIGAAIQPMGWMEIFEEGEDIPPLEKLSGAAADIPSEAPAVKVEEKPAEPEYYTKSINPKKAPELDAVVVKPGRPNIVKVYITPDYSPEMELMGYSNPMDKDTVIRVHTTFNKKKELVQVAFRGFK